jgi:hypothetical protein
MRIRLTASLAVLAAAAIASAQTQSPAPAPSPAPSAAPKVAASPKPHSSRSSRHSITGTIETYDAAAHSLTVKMRTKSSTFNVAEAKVYTGAAPATADELSKTGSRVTVKYVDKAGKHMASSVTLASAPAPKPSPAAKP